MNSTLNLTFLPVLLKMICPCHGCSTQASEFSVHLFNCLFFPILFSYSDIGNTYIFPMSVSDGFVGKILITDIARICRHDVSLFWKLRCGGCEQISPWIFCWFLFGPWIRRVNHWFLYVKSTSNVFYIFIYTQNHLKFEI